MTGTLTLASGNNMKTTKYIETNASFAEHNPVFRKACELARVEATPRQASKWRNRRGQAYEHRHAAVRFLNEQRQEVAQ